MQAYVVDGGRPAVQVSPPRVAIRITKTKLIAIGIAVALVALVALLLPGFLDRYVLAEARARGFVCRVEKIRIHVGEADLEGVDCTLADVRGLSSRAKSVTIALDRITPKSAVAEGLVVRLEDEAFLGDLALWTQAHGPAGGRFIAIDADKTTITWGQHGGPALAELTGGAFHMGPKTKNPGREAGDGGTGSLDNAKFEAFGRDFGDVDVVVASAPNELRLAIGPRKTPDVVRAVVTTSPSPRIDARADGVDLASAASLLGVRAPAGTFDVRAGMPLSQDGSPSAVDTNVTATLKGYVPPHPKELDGILYGASTTLRGHATLPPDRKKVVIDDAHVEAGAMKLAGAGTIDLVKVPPHLSLKLRGAIPCAALATSAAAADLGWLGPLAGKLARKTLTGSVDVALTVDADSDEAERPHLDTSIKVGCSAFGL